MAGVQVVQCSAMLFLVCGQCPEITILGLVFDTCTEETTSSKVPSIVSIGVNLEKSFVTALWHFMACLMVEIVAPFMHLTSVLSKVGWVRSQTNESSIIKFRFGL